MPTFTVRGKELIIREVKPHGNGAIIYVPKSWIGEKVGVVRGVEENGGGN